MKKYLLVLSSLELGGAEKQAINFAKYLKEQGRQVTILGLADFGVVCKICEQENIQCERLPEGNKVLSKLLNGMNILTSRIFGINIWGRGISLMLSLSKYIESNRFDICISYCAYANTILGCSKILYKKCKYVWFQRDAGIQNVSEKYQSSAIKQMNYILANAKSGYEWIKCTYGLDATLICNGVTLAEPQKSSAKWKETLQVDDADIVCTMVANLSSAKDHMSLLKAWKLLHEQNRDGHLILVFAGRFDEQYKTLLSYAIKNEILSHVRFLGQVEDITGLLQVTAICVFGAISEGSPNGVIEPALIGLPVVATNLPEIQEIVAEENYKYLFEKDDITTVADNVFELAGNFKLRKYLGEKNKEKALSMFSTEDNFAKIISIVE